MNILFDFTNIHLDENKFPKELGEIKKLRKETKVEKCVFYIDEPLISEKGKGLIKDIKKINFFVGSNNSGKSRFLRALLKLSSSENLFTVEDEKNNLLDDLFNIDDYSNTSVTNLKDDLKSLWNRVKILNQEPDDIKDTIVEINSLIKESNATFENAKTNNFPKIIIDKIQQELSFLKLLNIFIEKLLYHQENTYNHKVYIPIIRSLSGTNHSAFNDKLIKEVIEKTYKINNENLFTGLDLYNIIYTLTTSIKKKDLQKFSDFLSSNFFNGKSVELIADKQETESILLTIEDEVFPIYDIGDGIQQLILLMFPIFTAKNNTWFFIEEPETHLHPGLQRIFIETILNDKFLKAKNLRYFFTTHSNNFLDLSLQADDVSIFQFQKECPEKFNIKSIKPNKEILDLLGVNNSSVLMANSSIWVEGPTDRKYISKFLKLYCEQNKIQHLKEDIDFAFFEYGGNLIEHYLFDENFDEIFTEEEVRVKINSFALSNKIYLLADNDNAKGKKLARRKKLIELSESEKNFKYQNTNYREIENLLPVKVVKDFLVELVKDSEIDKIETIQFERKDYISTGLGEFIENLFEVNKIKGYKKFRDDSGTLKSSYKTKLCDFVINGDYTYDELIFENKQLDDIIVSLYNFIKPKQ